MDISGSNPALTIVARFPSLAPNTTPITIDRFTDAAAILISVVSNNYYGMLRGQIRINLPLEHPIMPFETIEIKICICKTVN